MKQVTSCRGVSLVELLVAQVLVMMTVLALSGVLIAAHRYARQSANWLHAITLMVDAQETIRAGHVLDPLPAEETHKREVSITPDPTEARLRRVEVNISWNDGRPHSWSIVGFMPSVE